MLLRNRSRAVTKPGLMADHSSQQSPNQNYARKIPSLFGSPKFRDFTNKCLSATEALKSPTSILEAKALCPFGFANPFPHDKNKAQTTPLKTSSHNTTSWDSKGIALALVGDNCAKQGNVLFGTKLRVKIPFECETCSGTKSGDSKSSYAKDGVVSWSEMELSEEYTCVISHGPNPRTTHIFNNCVVEETYCSLPQNSHHSFANFLSFCYTCKKHLDHTKDIFIYRGEKAFCSSECRQREMVLDDVESLEF